MDGWSKATGEADRLEEEEKALCEPFAAGLLVGGESDCEEWSY